MTFSVSDSRSNPNDQIEHAVRIIGRSKQRGDIFRAIYFGKQRHKTVDDIAKKTGLPPKRVLEEGKKLSSNGIVHQSKRDGKTCYEKDTFYSAQKGKILSLVANPKKLENLPTKTRPHPRGSQVEIIKLQSQSFQVSQITVDDIDSFSKVKKIDPAAAPIAMAERTFKEGVMQILGEKGK